MVASGRKCSWSLKTLISISRVREEKKTEGIVQVGSFNSFNSFIVQFGSLIHLSRAYYVPGTVLGTVLRSGKEKNNVEKVDRGSVCVCVCVCVCVVGGGGEWNRDEI